MKRKILIILFMSLFLFLTGCIKKVKIPVGVIPTTKFTIDSYINDNAVFQASTKLTLSGTSEEGVVIVITLTDNKGNIITESYCTTNEEGVWELTLNTPEASAKEYIIKIKDSNEVYRETINDVRFGEVWLLLGDNYDNINLEEEIVISEVEKEQDEELEINYDKMFFINDAWVPASSIISQFGYELLDKISSDQKLWSQYPVALVIAAEDDTAIYEWLSHDSVISRNIISNYIESEKIEIDTDGTNRYHVANLYNKYLNILTKMSYANVILHQGSKDLSDFNNGIHYKKGSFEHMYSAMYYTFLLDLNNVLEIYNDIYITQSSLSKVENANILREIQYNMSDFYSFVNLIPTYDLCLFYNVFDDEYIVSKDVDEENFDLLTLVGYDYELLINRIYTFETNNISAPILDHIVQEYDENNKLSSVKLIFKHVISFDEVDDIIGLYFYDSNNELLDLDFTIYENEITLDLEIPILSDEELEEIDEEEVIEYYDIAYIAYGNTILLYNNNLSASGIPVIPFVVEIK